MNSNKLCDPAVMLETLKLAYQHVRDEIDLSCPVLVAARRLTDEQERELGRRLAEYWTLSPK